MTEEERRVAHRDASRRHREIRLAQYYERFPKASSSAPSQSLESPAAPVPVTNRISLPSQIPEQAGSVVPTSITDRSSLPPRQRVQIVDNTIEVSRLPDNPSGENRPIKSRAPSPQPSLLPALNHLQPEPTAAAAAAAAAPRLRTHRQKQHPKKLRRIILTPCLRKNVLGADLASNLFLR